MAKYLGKDACICRDSGSWADPAHIPLISAKDISINYKPSATFDSTDRVSAATVITGSVIPTRHSVTATFAAIWNAGAGLTALRTAFLAGTPIRLAALNQLPTASGIGLRGDWLVKKFPLKFPLLDGQMVDIELVPHGNYTNAVVPYTDETSVLGTAESQVARKLGKNGSCNNNVNTPITAIRDFSFSAEWELAKADDRGSDFELFLPTKRKITAELEFMWDEADAKLVAFRTAWDAGAAIGLSMLDGVYATGGSWGIVADWAITDHPSANSLNDGQSYKIKLEPHGNGATAFSFLTTS